MANVPPLTPAEVRSLLMLGRFQLFAGNPAMWSAYADADGNDAYYNHEDWTFIFTRECELTAEAYNEDATVAAYRPEFSHQTGTVVWVET